MRGRKVTARPKPIFSNFSQAAVPMTVLHPLKDNPKGWHFVGPESDERFPECRPDAIGLGARFLTDVYLASDKDYTGRVSVPVLWVRTRFQLLSFDPV